MDFLYKEVERIVKIKSLVNLFQVKEASRISFIDTSYSVEIELNKITTPILEISRNIYRKEKSSFSYAIEIINGLANV